MKKVRRFPVKRIPAFVMYAIAAAYMVSAFTAGKGGFFMSVVFYLIGTCLDTKSNLYRK